MIWRITERRAFQDLARNGRRARTRTLWCSFVNDPAASPLRLAFSVGRSVGPATRRNQLRRRLRVIVDATASRAEIDCGWLLIGANPGATELTFEQLCGEVDTLVGRVVPVAVSTS